MEFDYSTTDWYYPQPDEGSDEKLHWLFAAGAAGRLPAGLSLAGRDAGTAPCAWRGRPGWPPAFSRRPLLLGPKPYVVFDRRRCARSDFPAGDACARDAVRRSPRRAPTAR